MVKVYVKVEEINKIISGLIGYGLYFPNRGEFEQTTDKHSACGGTNDQRSDAGYLMLDT